MLLPVFPDPVYLRMRFGDTRPAIHVAWLRQSEQQAPEESNLATRLWRPHRQPWNIGVSKRKRRAGLDTGIPAVFAVGLRLAMIRGRFPVVPRVHRAEPFRRDIHAAAAKRKTADIRLYIAISVGRALRCLRGLYN